MTETQLNIKAFEFVEKLKIIDKFPKSGNKPKLKGSLAEVEYVDLSDKVAEGPVIQTQMIPEINDERLHISIGNKTYGFGTNEYPSYYKYIYELSLLNDLHSKVSIKYLRTQTLLWIIYVFINNKARQDLLNFLLEKLESEIKRVKYYYPILNLTIEEPFEIGEAKITYFTKEYFDKYWEHSKEKFNSNKKEFDSLFRKYQGRVFIETEVNAESEKGQEISYRLASFTADVMILLSPTVVHPKEKCLIDLDKRIPWESEHISMDANKEFDFSISLSANRGTFDIRKEMISSIENNMLYLFGKVVKKNPEKEIDLLIINTIKLTAKAIRETDLHLRISLMIMIIESVFLLEDEDYRMEKKCKRRMCELLNPNGGKKHQKLFDTLSNMYEIRHKMTHKVIREYIEPNKLSHFQTNLIEVILQLLGNSNLIKTKDNLIKILDKKIKTNA